MIVGITGSIGAGKSTLARMLVDRGADLVDADRIGHEVIEMPPVKEELIGHFGSSIEGPDGSLDRRELGRLAFASTAGRHSLNQIVHPSLTRKLWSSVDSLAERPGRVVVVDAALLFEWGELERFDLVVVVRASKAVSMARVARRTGLGEAEVAQRMAHQMPLEEKVRRGDVIVDNDRTREELARQADELWQRIGRQKAVGETG